MLPTSPIKTRAGGQFQNKKAISEPIKGKVGVKRLRDKEAVRIMTNIQEPSKPSSPSIKLVKLMIEVAKTEASRKKIKVARVKGKPEGKIY